MPLPEIVSREEWLAARTELLAREKELTKAIDAVAADRRRLPMVAVREPYVFHGPAGAATLLDLFDGRRQLVVYHFMFQPEWAQGCQNCSGFAAGIGDLTHLNARDTTFAAVSRAPYPKIAAFRELNGWRFPWYSSYGTHFNHDFHVTFDSAVRPVEYNYRSAQEWERRGGMPGAAAQPYDLHGLSCFLREGDDVFHTYSTYGRGADRLGYTANLLDLTALGRQEDWEEPKGRA